MFQVMKAKGQQQGVILLILLNTVFIESLHPLSKCSPFVSLCHGIKLHYIILFPPLFTHCNPQLPNEKQILQVSEN